MKLEGHCDPAFDEFARSVPSTSTKGLKWAPLSPSIIGANLWWIWLLDGEIARQGSAIPETRCSRFSR